MTSIRDQLEQAVPKQRYQHQWRKHGGIDVRYRIWRGPLNLRAYRNRLHLSADAGYWISARKKLLGPLKISGDCGLHEPPRVARLHVSSRLYWGHDWRLHTETRIHRNRFANPCHLTRARIDVTPAIDRQLNRKMNQVLREQVDSLVPQLSGMRDQALLIWRTIQMPLRLDKDIWLLLQPESVHAAPFRAHGNSLTTAIGVAIRPKVVFGPKPEFAGTQLPNIDTRFHATKPGLNFLISVDIPLQTLNERLQGIAAKRLARLGAGEVELKHVRLHAEQGDLVLLTPSVSVQVTPMLAKDRQLFILDPVSLGRGSNSPAPTDDVSHDSQIRLTGLLGEALSWSYENRVQSIRNMLDKALNRPINPHMQLRGRIDVVEPEALHVETDRIRAQLRVSGEVSVLVK